MPWVQLKTERLQLADPYAPGCTFTKSAAQKGEEFHRKKKKKKVFYNSICLQILIFAKYFLFHKQNQLQAEPMNACVAELEE